MPVLRTRPLSTRLQLLVELHQQRHGRLRTLAQRVGVSVQAVSGSLRQLVRDGLVATENGTWRPTPKGTDHLQGQLTDVRRFLDGAREALRIIPETVALAARAIRRNDPVGLIMKEGRLTAVPRLAARSRGRARTDAGAGDLVVVGDLEGILDLHPAPIMLVAHSERPDAAALARARRTAARLRRPHPRMVTGAHALSSVALARQLGLNVDLEYAPLEAARDAARRGVAVLYLVPQSELTHCLAALREGEDSFPEPVPVRSVRV